MTLFVLVLTWRFFCFFGMHSSSVVLHSSLRGQKRRLLTVGEEPPSPRELIDPPAEPCVDECEGQKHPPDRDQGKTADRQPHRCNSREPADRETPARGESEVRGPEDVACEEEAGDDV